MSSKSGYTKNTSYLLRGSILQFAKFALLRVGEPVLPLLENLVHSHHHLHPSLALSGPAHICDLSNVDLLLLIAGRGHHRASFLTTSFISFDNLGRVDVYYSVEYPPKTQYFGCCLTWRLGASFRESKTISLREHPSFSSRSLPNLIAVLYWKEFLRRKNSFIIRGHRESKVRIASSCWKE